VLNYLKLTKGNSVTAILKKLKLDIPALLFIAGIVFISVFLMAAEVPSVPENDFLISTNNLPDKLQTNIPEFPCIFRNRFNGNSLSVLSSSRRNFHPVPPAYRNQELASLPLVKQLYTPVKHHFYDGDRSFFQKYLKYALPLRAGPIQS
jgi:hypothetical protein